jgi:glycosyltransferase involved in cell wall biosynthesis
LRKKLATDFFYKFINVCLKKSVRYFIISSRIEKVNGDITLKVLIIIPAYNEEKSISDVIGQIRLNLPEVDIVVVNDGSSDATSIKAATAGARVIDLPFNLGIGGAMQTGYLYAKNNSYDIAIQVDGDGQHNPIYIYNLMEPVIQGKADMVIGSRFVKETYYKPSLARKVGIIFFSSLVRFLTNQKVKDTTSGFRVVNKEIIQYFSNHYPTDYPEVDVLIRLYKKGFRVIEMPVEMQQRKTGKSSITPLRSIYYIVKVTISLLIGSLKIIDE